jgi:hypothetical protein
VNLDFFIGHGSPSWVDHSRKTLIETGPGSWEETTMRAHIAALQHADREHRAALLAARIEREAARTDDHVAAARLALHRHGGPRSIATRVYGLTSTAPSVPAHLAAARWPDKETVADESQGVQLATIQQLVRSWRRDYDWRRIEARLNALPQFITEIVFVASGT